MVSSRDLLLLSCFFPQTVPKMCQASVVYAISTDLDVNNAQQQVSKYFADYVDRVRKATIYKKEHCVEALYALSCFNSFPVCVC